MHTFLRNGTASASAIALLALTAFGCEPTPPTRVTVDAGGSGGSASGSGGSASGSGGSASGSGGSASGSGGSASGSGGSASGAGGSASGSGGTASDDGGSGGMLGTGGTGGAAGTGGAGGTGGAPLPVIGLPMAVTDLYNNQGWFGDQIIMNYFAPGLIKQGASSAGPCANRRAGAKGNCLEVIYTPPSGLSNPDGGVAPYLGVFFLTTLMNSSMPNWGTEPGKNIAPGAQRISFQAASPTSGLAVNFKAGVMGDSFTVNEQHEMLTTSWKAYSIPLNGQSYGLVVGAFAWVITDTKKPATFYLDNIVWE